MRQPTTATKIAADFRLEALVRELEDSPKSNQLIREHLETARFYLQGGMPEEYAFNLKLAENLLPEIDNEALRGRVKEFLQAQHRALEARNKAQS